MTSPRGRLDAINFEMKKDVYDGYLKLGHCKGNDITKIFAELCKKKRALTPINMSIHEYLYTGLPITPDMLRIINNINDEFMKCLTNESRKSNTTKQSVTLYHGTIYQFPKKFRALSFFSTTFVESIAKSYAGEKGNVYAIKVPIAFPFLNFQETLNYQILLPIGTGFTWNADANLYEVDIDENHLCLIKRALRAENIRQYGAFEDIMNTTHFESLSDNYNHDRSNKRMKCCLRGSSTIDIYNKFDKKYCMKDIRKKMDDYERQPSYVISRLLNEYMASKIYNQIFGLKTLDFQLVYNKIDTVYLSSEFKNLSSLTEKDYEEALKGFLADCILSNWDIINNNNIKKDGDTIVRVDVGGALAYRGNNDFKMEFFDYSAPIEHKLFLQNPNSFYYKCIKNLWKLGAEKITALLYENIPESNSVVLKKIDDILITQILKYVKHAMLTRFFDSIKKSVTFRLEYYLQETTKQEISDMIANIIVQSSGGASDKTHILYKKKIRKVYGKYKQYVIFERQKIYLDSIKKKYKYLNGGAGECENATNIKSEDHCTKPESDESSFYAIHTPEIHDKMYDKLLIDKDKNCKLGGKKLSVR